MSTPPPKIVHEQSEITRMMIFWSTFVATAVCPGEIRDRTSATWKNWVGGVLQRRRWPSFSVRRTSRPPSFHSVMPPRSRPAAGAVLRSTRRLSRPETHQQPTLRTPRRGGRSGSRNVDLYRSVSAQRLPSS